MGNQLMPLENNSSMNLCKVHFEVVRSTSVGLLFEIVANLETSSSHVPNSLGSLPSYELTLLR